MFESQRIPIRGFMIIILVFDVQLDNLNVFSNCSCGGDAVSYTSEAI